MKVLVSTKLTQGMRESDFCYVPEGEILKFGFACDSDRDDIDGHCGCQRSMCGIESSTATTTMMVKNIPGMTTTRLRSMVLKALVREGWGNDEDIKNIAEEDVKEIERVAGYFEIGSVLEMRGDKFNRRKI